jgi:hypothetical protein
VFDIDETVLHATYDPRAPLVREDPRLGADVHELPDIRPGQRTFIKFR